MRPNEAGSCRHRELVLEKFWIHFSPPTQCFVAEAIATTTLNFGKRKEGEHISRTSAGFWNEEEEGVMECQRGTKWCLYSPLLASLLIWGLIHDFGVM